MYKDVNNSDDSFEDNADLIRAGEPGSDQIPNSKPEDVVEEIRDLVGQDAVLIPITKGTKRPALADWPKLTIEAMSDEAHLTKLKEGGIGVVLGEASNRLCAIDIDDDSAVEPFLALNPTLGQTLRTRGRRGAQIWVRVRDEYPKLTKIKTKAGADWGEWRADGGQSVIHGIHPDTKKPYTILVREKPIEISFGDIQWPSELSLPWVKSDADAVIEAEGEPFSFSDRGTLTINQMFFVRKYTLENHVLYDSSLGEFFQYDAVPGLWRKQSVESIKRGFLDALALTARETGLSSIHLKRTNAFVGGLVDLLRATVEERDAFENRPPAIHVANGMICFGEDEITLKSFHPSYRSRNQCPFEFDPEAECPRFLNELLRPALDEDDITLLQKWAGSVLLGRNPAQRFLLMLGTPGGGKSTLMNVLERTIGLQNVSQLRTEHLADKFELYGFVGKTLLTGKDVAADFLMQKGAHVLKALVGHDLLEAEKKGLNDRVLLRGDFNVGITCNTDLNVRLQGDAGAWRRRLLVIKYDRPAPPKRIVNLPDQLLAEEGPGILRWMVEGAIALLDDLDATGDYELAESQKARIDRLMDQSDSVRHFVKDGVRACKGADIAAADLLVGYYEFCEARGWQPFSTSELRTQLPKCMLEVHKSNSRHDIKRGEKSVRGYKHVALVNGGDSND